MKVIRHWILSLVRRISSIELMRRRFSTLLKIAVSVAGIAFVLTRIDISAVSVMMLQADLGWLLLSFLLMLVSLVVRAFRWLLLVRSLGAGVSFGRLVNVYFVGNFFNAFLPTSFGGDVMRVVEVAQDVPVEIAAGTVIVDRLSGLLMLFVMALVVIPFRPAGFPDDLALLIASFSLASLIAGGLLLQVTVVRRFGGWLPGPISPDGQGPFARIVKAVSAIGLRPLGGALAVSALFNLILTLWWWSAGRALGFSIPLAYYLLVIPFLSVSQLIPSIGGLGPREVVATQLFEPALLASLGVVVPAGAGVALSLLVFVLQRLSGLPGGPIYALSNFQASRRVAPEKAKRI